MLDESDLSDLVADGLQALLLKSTHETDVSLELRHEEVFFYSEELSLHAQANEGGHMRIRVRNQDIFAPDDTAWTKARDLVHLMLFPGGLRAHIFALARELA